MAVLIRPLVWLTASLAALATALAASAQRDTPASAAPVAQPPREAAAKDDNPTVAPGLVKWHKSVAEAQAAARVSGKPVLLFHMMGQLDKQFC